MFPRTMARRKPRAESSDNKKEEAAPNRNEETNRAGAK